MKNKLFLLVFLGLFLTISVAGFAAEYDFEGETVTYVGWWDMFNGISDERISQAEEEFNVNIEQHHIFPWIEPYGSGIMSRLLAGDSTLDIWSVQNMAGFYNVMPQGGLYPLEDTLPENYYDDFTEVEMNRIKSFDYKGHRYAFGHTSPYPEKPWVMLYNQSMLERIGTEDPYQLFKENQWTWDAFTKIAREATADTDGDGEIDRYGLAPVHNGLLCTILAKTNGASVTEEVENGRILFTFDDKEALEAINMAKQWVLEDNIKGEDVGDNPLINGRVAFQIHLIEGLGYEDFHETLAEASDKFVLVPIPMGPEMNDYVFPPQALGSRVLPANTRKPEALLALDKFLFRGAEDYSLQEYLASKVTTEESAELLRTAIEKYTGDPNFMMEGVIGGEHLWPTIEEIFAGEKSAAAAIEEIKPSAQATLDDLFLD